jgi:hypothetical protein
MESTTFNVNSFAETELLEAGINQVTRSPRIINHGNISIVYIDFSGLRKEEEIYAAMENAERFIRRYYSKSLYTLTNLTGMHFNTEVYTRFVEYAKGNTPYVKASAVVGMVGLMQIFYNSFLRLTGRKVKACTTELEAKEYLASI